MSEVATTVNDLDLYVHFDGFQSHQQQHDMETEVVIWSSKVQHSPPPPPSNHAHWTARPLHEQPEVSWMPPRQPEPLPASDEVDFSTATPFRRCSIEPHVLND